MDARNKLRRIFVIKSKSEFLLHKITNVKPTAGVIPGGEAKECFALKWGRKQGCLP